METGGPVRTQRFTDEDGEGCAMEISLAGHPRREMSHIMDVHRALIARDIRLGLRNESGYLKAEHKWKVQTRGECREVAQRRRRYLVALKKEDAE
jgi:hypothetical protein